MGEVEKILPTQQVRPHPGSTLGSGEQHGQDSAPREPVPLPAHAGRMVGAEGNLPRPPSSQQGSGD